jgi:ribonuclease HII
VSNQLESLIFEADQLVSIFNASSITAKKNRDSKIGKIKSQNPKIAKSEI